MAPETTASSVRRRAPRLVVLGGAFLAVVASASVPADAEVRASPTHGAAAMTHTAQSVPQRVTRTFGRSVQGRALRVTTIGDPDATRRVLVVDCIHGNECDARPIVRRILRSSPPSDTAYVVVRSLNPDGARAGTRQNARGVDLNRNFPVRWTRSGQRGDTYYPGPRARSEPETRAMMRLVRDVRPTLTLWFHQRLDVVARCGGSRAVVRAYAERARMQQGRLTRFGGSACTWQRARVPGSTVVTVELPDRVRAIDVRRHAAAVRASALRSASRPE